MARALIFTATSGYRHESIEHGTEVLTTLLRSDGHDVRHTEDAGVFTPDQLAGVDVVVWLSVMGDVLDDAQRAAFASWLADGGAWVGVHGATAAEDSWDELPRIAGARFSDHPEIQPATVRVVDASHPSTAPLPGAWVHTDEWYNFAAPLRADRTVLLTVDESTYDGGTMGDLHPVAWHGPYHRGRTWYTALGHAVEAYDDPLLQAHLRGGVASVLA